MKLNLFTPLPPERTDIAQCVVRMLPALVARADVTLWTDQERVDSSISAMVPVRRFRADDLDWHELNYADFNLYNIGNDARFHASIMDVVQRYPGLVIMHDVGVHELAYATLERKPACRERYLELLERCGEEALWDGQAYLDGKVALRDIATRNPLAWWPLQGALGVVSHNAPALRAAVPELSIPLLDVPLPWRPRADLGAPLAHSYRAGDKLEMLICGFLNSPSRRLNEVLESMTAFPRRGDLFLHIAGQIKDDKSVKQKIAKLGLSQNVKIHGYLSEGKLGALMDRAHLALNLRWPSMGESSGAQLRFWNHSLPTLATQTGWYAQQPEDCLLFVSPDKEASDLHRYWNAALDGYEAIAELGLQGRRRLEERHSAEIFADALLDFLPVVDRFRSRAFVPALAQRAGKAMARLGLEDGARASLAVSVSKAIAGIAGIKGEGV